MNVPNQLTVLRLVLTLVFLLTMSLSFPLAKTTSLIIFAVASITDWLDGAIARKYGLITNFGKLMDPLADKIMMASGFIMLVAIGWLPGWMVVLIIAREFMVTGLRLVASAEGTVLAAENLGKYKTVIQIVTVIYYLLFLAASEAGSVFSFLSNLFEISLFSPGVLGLLLIWASLLLTLLSGFNYIWKNRSLLNDK